MKAVCWYGKRDVRVETIPDPQIQNARDAIVKISSTAICGSDLHLYNALIPGMEKGDVLGHEFMGEVVDVGKSVTKVKPGDRVVVPFCIACGHCWYCENEQSSLCDNTNPNAVLAEKAYGQSPAAAFGYSHMMGGYPGGQAQLVRVPYADANAFPIERDLPDEKLLFLTDILPTGYFAAHNCEIKAGDIVAIWGAGPVGQFAIKSAFMFGAERVIVIDHIPERLELARKSNENVTVLDYREIDILPAIKELTGGRGPDAVIDSVGMESHGNSIGALYDRAAQAMRVETDRGTALRELIMACKKGGIVSMVGVYGGILDKVPVGAAFAKGLRFKMGQTPVHRYMRTLYQKIQEGVIDPSFLITHQVTLDQAPDMYNLFNEKKDGCIKVVMKPN